MKRKFDGKELGFATKMMKSMGIISEKVEAEEVIIRTKDKEIVISNPEITAIEMKGEKSYQIVGPSEERPREKFSKDDIKMVIDQTGSSEEDVKKALEETGDIAEAIMKLKA